MQVSGYGVEEEQLTYNIDELRNQIINSFTDMRTDFDVFKENNKSLSYTDEDVFDMFCNDYFNSTYGWENLQGVVCDFVDELAFNGKNLLRYEDYCYYVDSSDALNYHLSKEDIENAFNVYLLPLLENKELDIQFLDIEIY